MTQFNLPTLGDTLLKQNGASALDAELGRLRQIVDNERRRAEALARWTRRVWLCLAAILVLLLLTTLIYATLGRGPVAATTAPSASSTPAPSGFAALLSMSLTALWLLSIYLVPLLSIVGIILTVLTFLARRTAGMNEIRTSLASIDAQLRALAGPGSAGIKS
jgi:Na+-transporting methylmalonyl-CoA/oxaloacetate decarboxylase gamma subunit